MADGCQNAWPDVMHASRHSLPTCSAAGSTQPSAVNPGTPPQVHDVLPVLHGAPVGGRGRLGGGDAEAAVHCRFSSSMASRPDAVIVWL